RHDCRIYTSAPPRLLDLGAGPEACGGRESRRPDRRTDIDCASRQYLAQLCSPHEPCGRSRDCVSRAGRCASRPRCPAPDSDAVGNKGIDLQAVVENVAQDGGEYMANADGPLKGVKVVACSTAQAGTVP